MGKMEAKVLNDILKLGMAAVSTTFLCCFKQHGWKWLLRRKSVFGLTVPGWESITVGKGDSKQQAERHE